MEMQKQQRGPQRRKKGRAEPCPERANLQQKQRRREGGVLHDPSTTSEDLEAGAALPDADSLALDGILAAEIASVLGVLGDLHLPDLLTQRCTITGAVLADNADLASALGLEEG